MMFASLLINKNSPFFISFLNLCQENEDPNRGSIKTNNNMKKQEGQKPFIIFATNTLINPNTMMVKSFDTMIAD